MPYTQDNRICSLTTNLGPDALLLKSLSGHEGISELFRFDLDLLAESDSIDFAELIGQPVSIQLDLADGESRYFSGIVSRFAQGAADRRFVSYRAEVVPRLWLLSRKTDCRIFQEMTTQAILEQIFSEFGITDFEFRLSSPPGPRQYCVQYRETSLAFISRLLEEDGCYYFFVHSEDGHTLVVSDDSSLAEECPGQAEAAYQDGTSGLAQADQVESWQVEQVLHTGGSALCDYNFETPSTSLLVGAPTATNVGGNEGLEHYDYHPGEYPDVETGETIARVRMEEQEAAAVIIRGTSSCRSFSTGFKFTLVNHYRPDTTDKPYLLTSIHHRLRQPADVQSGGEQIGATYENSFTCIPADKPFRPARLTPKPVVLGPQTALVVGPDGEEIHVDQYGRVKVRFYWDRLGAYDDTASCWVRVSRFWAGKNWGAVFHPRIGQEVIVDFLEGDPDKPLVTGSVYNAEQMPPYALPDNKTQSGIKSRSTPEGGPSNFNEIRFEDKKGQEEFFQHAEKTMTIVVKGSESESVGGSKSQSAGGSISSTAGKNISRTATENISRSAGKNIEDKAAGSYSLLTNQGIHLKTVHGAYEAITSAIDEAVAKLKGGDTGAAQASAESAMSTAEQTAGAAASAASSGASAAASAAESQASKVGEALAGLGTAVAAGAASEVLADKLLGALGAADSAKAEIKELIEGILPVIPSIVMWAMKNYQVQALWQISMSAKYNSVSIESEKKDVSVKAKKEMNLEASDKDFNLTAGSKDINVKAGKENINVTAKKKISIKAEDEDLVIEAGKKKVFIKAAKQIFLKCGKASISLSDSGNIVLSGNKININGKAPVQIKGKPIKLN
ncbi:MAG: type VI secretion system tip protein TssI/VgrG [Planctomycetota bacterium]